MRFGEERPQKKSHLRRPADRTPIQNFTDRRFILARASRIDYCISKQYRKGMTVDPLEIEDTSDWLGCPTELETCRYFLRVTENEVQELTLQLRKAREDIFGLVQMHADATRESGVLRAELVKAKADLADSNRRASDIETKNNWEMMANNKLLSELCSRIKELTGSDPLAGRR
jgi:hypothetical protein